MKRIKALTQQDVFMILSLAMRIGPAFVMASYGAFLSRTLHLSDFDKNMVNASFYVGMVCLEPITGAISDRFGRKISFLCYCVLFGFGNYLYSNATGFWDGCLAETFMALGSTCQSGSFSSWGEEVMKDQNLSEKDRHKFRSTTEIGGRAITLGLGFFGAALFAHDPHIMWSICCICMILTGIAALFLMNDTKSYHHESLKAIIADGYNFVISSPETRRLYAQSSVFMFCIQSFNMAWQDSLDLKGTGIGWTYVFMQCALLVGSFWARRKKSFSANTISQGLVWTGICLGLSAIFPGALGMSMFVLHEIPRGMLPQLQTTLVHNKITDDMPRATILSFESMLNFAGGFVGLVLSGLCAELFGLHTTWIISASILVVYSLFTLYRK